MTVRLIALDLDGTLLNHEGHVSPRNLAALVAAEAAGITVAIATGRRHCYAMKVLRGLPLRADTVLISSNGAVVRTFTSTLIERTHMQPASTRWLAQHLAEFRDALVITFDRVGPDGEDARGALVVEELADLHRSIGRWMIANEPYIANIPNLEACLADDNDPPIQMMLCGTVERMHRAEARMLEHPEVSAVGEMRTGGTIALNRTEYPERDLSIVDILPAGCSKGAALLRLAASLGIPANEIMAIGDNWNDLSMLEIAGHPILMGNAPEDLQQLAATKAWRTTAPHHEDGVAEAIESHALGALDETVGNAQPTTGLANRLTAVWYP